jgi:hypothetical protein
MPAGAYGVLSGNAKYCYRTFDFINPYPANVEKMVSS